MLSLQFLASVAHRPGTFLSSAKETSTSVIYSGVDARGFFFFFFPKYAPPFQSAWKIEHAKQVIYLQYDRKFA